MRITAIPPIPGAVEMAQIVSSGIGLFSLSSIFQGIGRFLFYVQYCRVSCGKNLFRSLVPHCRYEMGQNSNGRIVPALKYLSANSRIKPRPLERVGRTNTRMGTTRQCTTHYLRTYRFYFEKNNRTARDNRPCPLFQSSRCSVFRHSQRNRIYIRQ